MLPCYHGDPSRAVIGSDLARHFALDVIFRSAGKGPACGRERWWRARFVEGGTLRSWGSQLFILSDLQRLFSHRDGDGRLELAIEHDLEVLTR